MWPVSIEVSFTTAVYLMCSISALSVWKSCADLSIIPRTPSMVQFAPAWAAPEWNEPAAQHKITSVKRKNRRFKCSLVPGKMRRLVQSFGIVAYTERCANSQARFLQDFNNVHKRH